MSEYNFKDHVASDIGTHQVFLPPDKFEVQNTLDRISCWTEENLMKLNPDKCYYMIFSRSEIDFATRLSVNNRILDQKHATKLLGVWLEDTMSWSRNCKELCMKSYSRLTMITKLKYVGVKTEDLIDIYKLFIRSCLEYCSVVYHSSLTIEQSNKLERVQKTCLKVILGDNYVSYEAALEMSGLESLFIRRTRRCLNFSLGCLKYSKTSKLFPLNQNQEKSVRNHEKFHVNFAKTSKYQHSAIPYCQKLLNEHFRRKN